MRTNSKAKPKQTQLTCCTHKSIQEAKSWPPYMHVVLIFLEPFHQDQSEKVFLLLKSLCQAYLHHHLHHLHLIDISD